MPDCYNFYAKRIFFFCRILFYTIIDQWCDLKEERASAHISKEEAEIIIKKEVEARVAEIEDGYLEQIAGLKRELEALKKK